ncbi:MAG: hypothetical protein ACXVFL_11795, partial [Solirubrobacteraceae bacterium]
RRRRSEHLLGVHDRLQPRRPLGLAQALQVTEHELGHLNGHDHTAEEGDMMSPSYYAPTPECAAATMPGARAARAGVRAATARRGRAHARARR